MSSSAQAFQAAMIAATFDQIRQHPYPVCLLCGAGSAPLTSVFSSGLDEEVSGLLVAPPGLVRLIFYRACRPCQRRQEADGAERFVSLERAVLNLANPDVIRVVDVSYEVFLAWREGLVRSG